MKIHSPMVPTADMHTYSRVGRTSAVSSTQGTSSAGRAAEVQSSDFLSELHAAARSHPYGEVRTEKVAEAKADIAAGRLGTDADFERTVDALLRGF